MQGLTFSTAFGLAVFYFLFLGGVIAACKLLHRWGLAAPRRQNARRIQSVLRARGYPHASFAFIESINVSSGHRVWRILPGFDEMKEEPLPGFNLLAPRGVERFLEFVRDYALEDAPTGEEAGPCGLTGLTF